ncbi:hypothetical protein BKA02_000627 [Microbacterium pseudoresistens]|uniref:DUF3052 domain-containing protein n=1 Tax=Microbacterium pseudoresistens TaxID=640634 RepID=A0A7Y9JLD0_9MICO|nr:hypothetical protein [Microbacterium pseudoresistens]
MAKTVAEKLQIQTGDEVLLIADVEQRTLLDPLPADVVVIDGIDRATGGIAIAFVADRADLDARLGSILPHVAGARAAWLVYPKGNRSDVNRDSIWQRVGERGWTLNANVAVDDTWSAVRMKPAG